ncbi:MAG: ImmA/IrrE family metallo-endopeptidase [bacterium]|nr:ImmA/IrrE family metallo-endopeptidase [bacterium]
MTEYIVESKSRLQLRAYAMTVREYLHLKNEKYFPITELLDVLAVIFDGFSYEIVEDNQLPVGTHADTDVRTGHIRIKESVYDGACNGNGRDRMTIAHELGHFFTLCFCGFKLERNFSREKVPAYRDPEWQAKCFAGELLIPAHLMKGYSVDCIVKECGVSYDAAKFQYKYINS